jgi:putative DNA primase/helicase
MSDRRYLPILPNAFEGIGPTPQLVGAPAELLKCDDLSAACDRELCWLWPDRIPVGHLTLFRGEAGCGKSLMLLDIAARVSRDFPMPGQHVTHFAAGNVALISSQENVADTLLARLTRAGADLQQIRRMTRFSAFHTGYSQAVERNLVFPDDLTVFSHEVCDQVEPQLIVIDPLSDFCPDPKRFPEVLESLDELAAKIGVAILAALPGQARRLRDGTWRVSSRWNDDRARCVWDVIADPKDKPRRLLLPARLSLGPLPAPLAFRITDGRIAWDTSPQMAPTEAELDEDDVTRWLRSMLSAGERHAYPLIVEAARCGWSKGVLKRVRRNLKVHARREGFGEEGKWFWSLPGTILAARADRPSSSVPAKSDAELVSAAAGERNATDSEKTSAPMAS